MDYLGAFRHIFAYAAHLGLASCHADDRHALDLLIAQTHARFQTVADPRFPQAWLALCAWLDETLGAGYCQTYFPDHDPDDAFFDTLGALLLAREDGSAADVAVIRVYANALNLGFKGRYRAPEWLPQLETFRQRCNYALARPRPANATPSRPVAAAAGNLVLWLAPVAVTIALYSIYRFILSDLYASVVG